MTRLREKLSRLRVELSAFAVWWAQELREAGEAVLARLAPRLITRTLIRLERDGGSVWTLRGAHRERVCTFVRDATGAWPRELEPSEAATAVRGTRAVFGFAPEYVLTHKLVLPVSVERELEQVLALQLERDCPMPLDQVYVDGRAGKRSRTGAKLEVNVLIVQRERVERVRELAGLWGLRLARVGVISGPDTVMGDFLRTPATQGLMRLTRTDRRLGVAAIILAVACTAVITFQWSYERVKVGRELRSLQAPAAAAETLARQLKIDAAPAEALVSLMRLPDALDVLTTLTEGTPKDTWFYDLDITAQWPQIPHIKLSGFTPVATILVGALQNTGKLNDVRLVSATSAGLGSGQDRLQLTAQLASSAKGNSTSSRAAGGGQIR